MISEVRYPESSAGLGRRAHPAGPQPDVTFHPAKGDTAQFFG